MLGQDMDCGYTMGGSACTLFYINLLFKISSLFQRQEKHFKDAGVFPLCPAQIQLPSVSQGPVVVGDCFLLTQE